MGEDVRLSDFLKSFFEEMGFMYLKPSPIIKEIFTTAPEIIATSDLLTLDTYLIALGQYLIFIRAKSNLAKFKFDKKKHDYERYIYKKTSSFTGRLTMAEKIARIEAIDPKAIELGKEVKFSESAKGLLDGVIDNIMDLNNNIKKVHDHRREELRLTNQAR